MAPLDAKARAGLRDNAFAYVDSKGQRRLPIHDAPHVRNALARFEQTRFESDAARERARQRLLQAAKKFGISPIGFFGGQLRTERRQAELRAHSAKIASLPRGIVTFLWLDVEGSTPLAQQLGDEYPRLLDAVWKTINAAVRQHTGAEVDIRGDEYIGVFRKPLDALNAAVGIQRELAQRRLPREVRVRIGLHTGRPTISDAAYVGITVHTAARVCAAGHGGQILLSSAAYDAMSDALPAGMSFRPLGSYTLAGLPEPEALFQLEAAGLVARFPKLRARQSPQPTLPGKRGRESSEPLLPL
jgi:class 3 adenylate cyclase